MKEIKNGLHVCSECDRFEPIKTSTMQMHHKGLRVCSKCAQNIKISSSSVIYTVEVFKNKQKLLYPEKNYLTGKAALELMLFLNELGIKSHALSQRFNRFNGPNECREIILLDTMKELYDPHYIKPVRKLPGISYS